MSIKVNYYLTGHFDEHMKGATMLYVSVERIRDSSDERGIRAAIESALGEELADWHVRVVGDPVNDVWKIHARCGDFTASYELNPNDGHRETQMVESVLREWADQRSGAREE